MRSLFLRIFLSYWMAQALFLVLAILVTVVAHEKGEASKWQEQQTEIMTHAVQAYEQQGPVELHQYLSQTRDSRRIWAYLLNSDGREVSGYELPRWGQAVAKGLRPAPREYWQRFTPSPFRRHVVHGTSGKEYIFIAMLPPGPFGPDGVPGLGILIAIISSGLVCYLLARYLTSPIGRLREATRRLAEGDLSARAGGGSELQGGDEITGLVHDFDAMAGRLEQSVNAQSRLLHDISHELRSPLARLNVALALARQRTGPAAQSTLDRIELEAERLNALIGDLLTIARLENGKDVSRETPVHLAELVEGIADDADFEAQSRKSHVETRIQHDCVVLGHKGLLRSAIENVVRNAIRYTAEGTTVNVRLTCSNVSSPEAVIQVNDAGPGVPEDSLDKLFRPFYRIDDARGRGTGGVGLGLAITDRAVRLHNGSVKATNRPEGGLMVEIRIPSVASVPTEPAPMVETPAG